MLRSLVFSTALLFLAATAVPAATPVGLVAPISEETLAATVVGKIALIHVREGATVQAGDLLLELEKVQEELEVERRRLVYENETELTLAAQRAEVLEAEWRATARLRETSRSVSQDELNRKELEFRTAAAEHAQLKVRKQLERIELDLAREALARRQLRAPGPGVVTEIFLSVGEVADARQPLVRTVNPQQCEWTANAEAAGVAGLTLGQTVGLRCESTAGPVTVSGEITYIAPVLDAASGLRRIKVVFDNRDGRVTPGVSATLVQR